ncbi:MAG: hypothetical protein NUV98_04225 [Candidatus Roizmanbacteria bacterium]|nr:hypothetical protein [Candidatus Roizmanbacteria bacterium]
MKYTNSTQGKVYLIENHNEMISISKANHLCKSILVHIDAHLDYQLPAKSDEIDIGNFLFFAAKYNLADTIYWIVPDGKKNLKNLSSFISKKLLSVSSNYELRSEPIGLSTIVNNTTKLIVCDLYSLPAFQNPVLLDIDIDYFIYESADDANRLNKISHQRPWITARKFMSLIGSKIAHTQLTSICYSVSGGWTPMRYKVIGDQLAYGFGVKNEKITQRLLAGKIFEKFAYYFERDNISLAKKYYEAAVYLNPTYYSFYTTYGPLYLLDGNLTKAEIEFNKMLQVDGNNYYAFFGLSIVNLMQKKFVRAKAYMEKLHNLPELKKETLLYLSYIESKLHNSKQAYQFIVEYMNEDNNLHKNK